MTRMQQAAAGVQAIAGMALPRTNAIIMSRTLKEGSAPKVRRPTSRKRLERKGFWRHGSACGPVIVPVFKAASMRRTAVFSTGYDSLKGCKWLKSGMDGRKMQFSCNGRIKRLVRPPFASAMVERPE
jgi:hypothetical protein